MATELCKVLEKLRRGLPEGSTFRFEVHPDELHLLEMRVPVSGTGAGTRFLAAVLAEADLHGVPVALEADPSDDPDTPSTFELVRWYARFGFEVTGVDANDWVTMRREPKPRLDAGTSALRAYEAARSEDLTEDGFDEILRRVAPGLRDF